MPTVTIDGSTYDVYADVAAADTYYNGSVSATGDAWRNADADTKARSLVTATRWIDSQCWKGEKTDPGQTLDWPRTGIEGVDSATVPAAIVQTCITLAGMLVVNPDLWDQLSGAIVSADGGTKRLKAGSVEIEYFRALNFTIWGGRVVGPFPKPIMELIGAWLCDTSSGSPFALAGSVAFGTCYPSQFKRGKFRLYEAF